MRSSDTSVYQMDILFDTRIYIRLEIYALSPLSEGLCAAVSFRFDGLSGAELCVNVWLRAKRTRVKPATPPGSDTMRKTRNRRKPFERQVLHPHRIRVR